MLINFQKYKKIRDIEDALKSVSPNTIILGPTGKVYCVGEFGNKKKILREIAKDFVNSSDKDFVISED